MKVRWILEQVLVHGCLFTYCLLSPYESNPSYQHGYVWIIWAVQCNKCIVYTYMDYHDPFWDPSPTLMLTVNIDRKVPPLLATTWLCVLGAYGNFPGWFSLQRLLLKTGCWKTLPLPKDRCDKAFHQKCHEPPAWIPAVCEWFVCIDLLLFLIETSKKRSPECDGSKGRLLWEPRRPMATTSIWRREELDCVQPGQRVCILMLFLSFWDLSSLHVLFADETKCSWLKISRSSNRVKHACAHRWCLLRWAWLIKQTAEVLCAMYLGIGADAEVESEGRLELLFTMSCSRVGLPNWCRPYKHKAWMQCVH